jgi:hypothetical protein
MVAEPPLDADDLTAMFRIAYDVPVRRCDVCERCGKAPVSKALTKFAIAGRQG